MVELEEDLPSERVEFEFIRRKSPPMEMALAGDSIRRWPVSPLRSLPHIKISPLPNKAHEDLL
jgi:hypothetical protein